MDNEKLQAGFVRNRRFLIGASLALAFTLGLGIQFKQISFLGNSADVPHPKQVIWIIWIVWAWSLAQYIVWFRDVGAWSEFKDAVSGTCAKHFGELAAAQPLPQWLIDQLAEQVRSQLRMSPYGDLVSKVQFYSRFSNIEGDGKKKDRVANVLSQAYVRFPDRSGQATSPETRIEVEISDADWRKYSRIATIRILFTSRFLLEYFAPFLIGTLPVLAAIYRHYCPVRG
jgi:hypothetical protein